MSERHVVAIALLAAASMIIAPLCLLMWMTAVPGQSFTGPLPPLTAVQAQMAGRLRSDVVAIASVPHNVAHPAALDASARHIESALRAMGYDVGRQKFQARGRSVRNIEVVVNPAETHAPTLIVGAHYDSFSEAPGANDNGTGTAALLELARQLAALRSKASVRIRLVFFVNEEPPFFQTDAMGSLVYAKALKQRDEKIVGMLSLETLGFYRDLPGSQRYPSPLNLLYPDTGNFIAFVGTTASRPLVRKTIAAFRARAAFPSEGGSAPAFVRGIDWSDHWSFEQVGIPAVMITDTAVFRYPHYHRTTDRPDKIDYDKLARVVSGLVTVVRDWR